MARRLCLAVGLATVALAAEAQDASALVQSALHAHRDGSSSSRRSGAGLGSLVDAAFKYVARRARKAASLKKDEPPAPESAQETELVIRDAFSRSSGTISFHRLDDRATVDGAFAVINAQKIGCRTCFFQWGQQMDLLSVIHVPTYIKRGDRVNVVMNLTVDVKNIADPMSTVFVGEPYTWTGHCDICDGSCRLVSIKEMDSFSMIIPTLVRGEDICDGADPKPNLTDVVLLDYRVNLPPIDMIWLQMDGHMNISMSVNRDQRELTSTAVSFVFNGKDVKREAPSWPPLRKRRHRSTLLVDDSEKSAKAPEFAAELPGLLQVAVDSFFPEEENDAGDEEVQSESGNGEEEEEEEDGQGPELLLNERTPTAPHPIQPNINAVRTAVTVHQLENWVSNVSFRIVDGGQCMQGLSAGSTDCILKFGDLHVYNTRLHLATTFEQGSYVLMSIKPTVEGPMGGVLKDIADQFKIEDLELPACGEPMDFVFNNKWHRWSPWPCGYYEFNLNMPHKEVMLSSQAIASPALRVYKRIIPGMRLNFALLPPVNFNMRLKVYHYGAAPVADLEFNFGTKKVM